jgi:hypothetical protein
MAAVWVECTKHRLICPDNERILKGEQSRERCDRSRRMSYLKLPSAKQPYQGIHLPVPSLIIPCFNPSLRYCSPAKVLSGRALRRGARPATSKFPVFFPVSKEIWRRIVSHETTSSASKLKTTLKLRSFFLRSKRANARFFYPSFIQTVSKTVRLEKVSRVRIPPCAS